MAFFSRTELVPDGIETDFTYGFDYIETDDIFGIVDLVITPVTHIAGDVFRFAVAPTAGQVVYLARDSDRANIRNVLAAKSFVRSSLYNNNNEQLLFLAQEQADALEATGVVSIPDAVDRAEAAADEAEASAVLSDDFAQASSAFANDSASSASDSDDSRALALLAQQGSTSSASDSEGFSVLAEASQIAAEDAADILANMTATAVSVESNEPADAVWDGVGLMTFDIPKGKGISLAGTRATIQDMLDIVGPVPNDGDIYILSEDDNASYPNMGNEPPITGAEAGDGVLHDASGGGSGDANWFWIGPLRGPAGGVDTVDGLFPDINANVDIKGEDQTITGTKTHAAPIFLSGLGISSTDTAVPINQNTILTSGPSKVSTVSVTWLGDHEFQGELKVADLEIESNTGQLAIRRTLASSPDDLAVFSVEGTNVFAMLKNGNIVVRGNDTVDAEVSVRNGAYKSIFSQIKLNSPIGYIAADFMGSTENVITWTYGAQVSLYYNNSEQIRTTSDGAILINQTGASLSSIANRGLVQSKVEEHRLEVGSKTISTAQPSGGVDGDVWYVVT